jgi:hypothetical protein
MFFYLEIIMISAVDVYFFFYLRKKSNLLFVINLLILTTLEASFLGSAHNQNEDPVDKDLDLDSRILGLDWVGIEAIACLGIGAAFPAGIGAAFPAGIAAAFPAGIEAEAAYLGTVVACPGIVAASPGIAEVVLAFELAYSSVAFANLLAVLAVGLDPLVLVSLYFPGLH